MTRSTRRRSALAAAAALALMTALTSCAASAEQASSSSDAAPLATASIQLGWFPNVQSMAIIGAKASGYFSDAGTDVDLLPGGPGVATDAQVVSGNALVGLMTIDALADAVQAGAPLVSVGAEFQTSTACVLTLADSGIESLKDLEGRKMSWTQTDDRLYEPFLQAEGVDTSKIEKVSGTGDPAALISGEVDAMSAHAPNQPVSVRAAGLETKEFCLSDYGFNRWGELLVVRKDSLEDPAKRATVTAIATGVRHGLLDAVADPDAAAQTVFDEYGESGGLVLANQVEGAKIWARLATESTEDAGVLRVTEAGIASEQDFFDKVGRDDVDAAALFDMDYINEVFDSVDAG